jgi:hypothetical protein
MIPVVHYRPHQITCFTLSLFLFITCYHSVSQEGRGSFYRYKKDYEYLAVTEARMHFVTMRLLLVQLCGQRST